jgi:hypothetical protein
VKIGVGVELPCHQIVQVLGVRGEDKGQAIDDRVDQAGWRYGRIVVDIVYAGHCEMLAEDEGKIERELFVVR